MIYVSDSITFELLEKLLQFNIEPLHDDEYCGNFVEVLTVESTQFVPA